MPNQDFCDGHNIGCKASAADMPAICATMKAGAPVGAIPANVLVKTRAIVTAGLAKDVEAVNQ